MNKPKWQTKNYVGITSGADGTYFSVVHQAEGKHVDFPAMIDGVEVPYDRFTANCRTVVEMDAGIKKYFAAKIRRERDAIILTVTGNPISCESYLQSLGYDCISGAPHTVDIYGHNSTVRLSDIGRKGGLSTSPAKKKSSADNLARARAEGKTGGYPKGRKRK